MRLEELLLESQTPKKFWLVFDIPNWDEPNDKTLGMVEDISNGKLKGLKGISGSREILTEWWMIARNAALMMDAKEVLANNKIEQIRYDDPDHLCEDNFRLLYRIWDKTPSRKYGKQQMMLNLMQYTLRNIGKTNHYLAHIFSYYGVPTRVGDEFEDNTPEVNSLADAQRELFDLVDHVINKVGENKTSDFNRGMFNEALEKALLEVGRLYSSEAEWVVHNDEFIIPEGSPMLIGVDFQIVKTFDEWKKNPDKPEFFTRRYGYQNYDRLTRIIHEYGLHKKYKIKLVDSRKWEEVRSQVTARRRKAGIA